MIFLRNLYGSAFLPYFTPDTDLQVTAAASLKPMDVAFVVSYSGENADSIEVAKQANLREAKVICLTGNSVNTLRAMTEIELLVPAFERIYRHSVVTSHIDQLTVVDLLYSIIAPQKLDTSILTIKRTIQTIQTTYCGKE